MGFMDNARRAAAALVGVELSKAAPTDLGEQMQAANVVAGMSGNTPMGPGEPLTPAWGYNQTPRRFDYMPGRNITTRPRLNEKISFETMRQFVESYDVAQACITHRIDSIRSLAWDVLPIDGVEGSPELDWQIAMAKKIMAKPDGRTPFASFLNEFLYDVLAFDAGCLYKLRNNAGQAIGLKPIDGTTIAPLLDGWGDTPEAGAAAYVQIVHGIPTEWYDDQQLVYVPFRKLTKSPYGTAPLEAVMVNASADIKYQLHFLRNYTAGNIPAMFGILPAEMSPQQRREWQDNWDAFLGGDENVKSQIRWVPGGTQFKDLTIKEFDKDLADWFMRKTCAAYHISPQELGYVADVNRANGETQENVQQRVGDLPLQQHVEGILSRFLQEDLGAPVEFHFDAGGETEDRLATAQSDKVYIEAGVVSVSDIAEMRGFGVDTVKVPRFIYDPKLGPIPLSSLVAASAAVDPETAEPVGVLPATQNGAEHIQALTIADGGKPDPQQQDAAAVGTTAAMATMAKAVESERSAFRKFVKTRRARGSWRDFQFRTAPAQTARELNKLGREIVRKDNGQVAVAGLCVLAADTGRVLMLQRALDPDDPAQGTWEFPGGHLEDGEMPVDAARREWQEEVGIPIPTGVIGQTWTNGHYQGFVYRVDTEASVPCRIGSTVVLNPDDPDGDQVETVAWWNPADLVDNRAVRAELAADLSMVLAAIADKCPCCDGTGEHDTGRECYGCDASGLGSAFTGDMPCAGALDMEADAAPLVKGWRDGQPKTPMHNFDLAIIDHYQPLIFQSLAVWVNGRPISAAIAAVNDPYARMYRRSYWDEGDKADRRLETIEQQDEASGEADNLQAPATIDGRLETISIDDIREALKGDGTEQAADGDQPLSDLFQSLKADAYLTGSYAGGVQLANWLTSGSGIADQVDVPDWSAWVPGDAQAALAASDGGLRSLLDNSGITIHSILDGLLDQMGNQIADGLAHGMSPDQIAGSIVDLLNIQSRATMIAQTETARAQIAGAANVYGLNGVNQWDLVTADNPCEECIAIAENNPYDLHDFEDMPPVHPYCRCSMTPVLESITESPVVTEETESQGTDTINE